VTAQADVDLEGALDLPPQERLATLCVVAERITSGANGVPATLVGKLVSSLVEVVDAGVGTRHERLGLGEALGVLGDPRLTDADASEYWADVDDGLLTIARFMVTNREFQRFVSEGGYDDPTYWSEQGRAWLASGAETWSDRAKEMATGPYLIPNQPVVGVTWFEAEAFANRWGARLARFDERLVAVRGDEKRPYPWGSPFGSGNANTREEVLGRPCAVGLYVHDRTPEGICDLAGNVAEWMADGIGDEKWIHPGAWDQPSMAAWAKARSLEAPDSRWAGLGFRLARD
jgi:hypothetical protein